MTDANALTRFHFFASFSFAQLQRLAERAPRESLPAESVVFRVGDHTATMYLILDGQVRIERVDERGQAVDLGALGPYQTFGELALLSNEPRMATVITLTQCQFLLIDRSLLLDILQDATPEAIFNIFSVLSQQIRAANEEDFRKILTRRTLEAQMEVEKQRGLTQLVAGVAHEINTPLGVINTAASIVERELEKFETVAADRQTRSALTDARAATALIKGNIQRAHKLVQDFQKVSVSQLSDVREPINLPEAVQEIIDLAGLNFSRNKIGVTFTHALPAVAQNWVGYRSYLSQILLNLLTNVERYAYEPGQGGTAEVSLRLEDDKTYALAVRDFGKGIPASDVSRVFEPFFTTGRAVGGTGLGLTIVYNLVTTALHGHVAVHSTMGQGTTVCLVFPRIVPE